MMLRPSTHPVQYSSQSKPTAVARENQRTNFESGIFSSNPKEKLKERPSARAKLLIFKHEAPKEHEGGATWKLQCLMGFDRPGMSTPEYTWRRRRVGKTHVMIKIDVCFDEARASNVLVWCTIRRARTSTAAVGAFAWERYRTRALVTVGRGM